MEIKQMKVGDLVPYLRNAKKHDQAQIDNVAQSIKEFGIVQPIVVDKDNNIIIGHCRLLACKKLKLREVPVVKLEDLTPEEANKLRLLDNKLNESDWDFDLLAEDIPTLDFTEYELDWALPEIEADENEQTEIQEDTPPDDVETRCKLGDIWKLGEHRLICGDSTDPAVIDRLMDGVKADMVFTDPPYNVAVGSKNKILNEQDGGCRNETEIAGDKGMTDAEIGQQLWRPAFQNMADHAKDDCSIYVTMPQGGTHMMMMMMMADACWQVKHELMWLKNQPTFSMGRLDYDYKHEPIMYGWKKTHNFYGKGKFTKSVWEIDKPRESKLHPTMKPIELIANALENSTKENDCVLDVFGGSGSTLIACEQLNRKCYMAELDPKYVSVILQRYINFKGSDKDVFLLKDGKKIPYNEVE